jgi:uncharacterized protein (TIGR02270 family)
VRAARFAGDSHALAIVERALADDEVAPRNAAIESGLILGSTAAWSRCLQLARAQAPGVGPLLTLIAQLATDREQEPLYAAMDNKELRRHALFAAGFAGTRRAADVCAEALGVEADARLAAEALCAITGLDLQAERLVAPDPPSPNEPIPFEQEDLDANLVPTPGDLLPRPDVAGVRAWWLTQRGRVPDGARCLAGKSAGLAQLQDALRVGPMRRRHAIALELSIRRQGRYAVATRAFTATQRQQMRAGDERVAAGLPSSPLDRLMSRI